MTIENYVHYHNLTGRSNVEDIDYTLCSELTHCPAICDCHLDDKPCTATRKDGEYIGKHRHYLKEKVYRPAYVGKHREPCPCITCESE